MDFGRCSTTASNININYYREIQQKENAKKDVALGYTLVQQRTFY